jgi:hypothetical protein
LECEHVEISTGGSTDISTKASERLLAAYNGEDYIVGSGTFDFPLEGDAMHAQWLDE